jgi:SEC-C motif-containing protein
MMRSRYSAYALGEVAYLLKSWHPMGRPKSLQLDPEQRWLSLEILGRTAGGILDERGTVEYRARYTANGVRGEQTENSIFVREGRQWLYVGAAT